MTLNVIFDISDRLATFLERSMATFAEFSASIDKLEAAVKAHNDADAAVVSDLHAQIDALKQQLADGGMSVAEEAAAMNRIDALVAQLSPPS